MSDFCLHPDDMACITRQGRLMDRMSLRAGVSAGEIKAADPWHWHEARLRCIGCALSRQCAQFLASPHVKGQRDVPAFCRNRAYFTRQGSNPTSRRMQ
jgi:hypothetical protein